MKRLRADDELGGDLGTNGGSYADHVRENKSLFALKPNHFTMIEAAAVPLVCVNDYQVFFSKGSPTLRQVVLLYTYMRPPLSSLKEYNVVWGCVSAEMTAMDRFPSTFSMSPLSPTSFEGYELKDSAGARFYHHASHSLTQSSFMIVYLSCDVSV